MITLRDLRDDDLDDLFRWRAIRQPLAWRHSRVPIPRTGPRSTLTTRVRSDPNSIDQAIEEDGVLAGMIASFTIEGDRELTYWIDPLRWGRGIATAADEGVRPARGSAAAVCACLRP